MKIRDLIIISGSDAIINFKMLDDVITSGEGCKNYITILDAKKDSYYRDVVVEYGTIKSKSM